jgi:hypothetical protein
MSAIRKVRTGGLDVTDRAPRVYGLQIATSNDRGALNHSAESETILTSALTPLDAAEVLWLLPDSEPGQDVSESTCVKEKPCSWFARGVVGGRAAETVSLGAPPAKVRSVHLV